MRRLACGLVDDDLGEFLLHARRAVALQEPATVALLERVAALESGPPARHVALPAAVLRAPAPPPTPVAHAPPAVLLEVLQLHLGGRSLALLVAHLPHEGGHAKALCNGVQLLCLAPPLLPLPPLPLLPALAPLLLLPIPVSLPLRNASHLLLLEAVVVAELALVAVLHLLLLSLLSLQLFLGRRHSAVVSRDHPCSLQTLLSCQAIPLR
mmetsp:Transcript_7162/g.30496  ORF Transcript_7162/g.30496 Transcript_7162/m.30496 type:complete len:210 (-) Transcript_7162:279-908(-)